MRQLRQVEAGLEVGGHETGVLLRRGVRGRLVEGLAGVVDEDVQLAPHVGAGRGHEPLPVAAHGDVACGARDAAAQSAGVRVGLPTAQALMQVGVAPGAGVHPRPKPGKLLHDGMPRTNYD